LTDEILTRSRASAGRTGWLAAGGMIGALLVSSCCLAPLLFVLVGVSGAWISNLTALEPYRACFAAIALAFIGLGFWRVYLRPRAACADGTYCAAPRSLMVIKTVLWIATALVALALTTDWWAPYFY
jgi:mercuric ion transport protein